MFLNMGYEHDEEHSNAHVQMLVSRDPASIIELHTRLWEDYEGRQMSVLESLALDAELVSVKACGLEIMTLEPTRHLIYQIFHIIKHFMLEKIGVRYLVDITLFIEKYAEQIDFKFFRESMHALGYAEFSRQFFNLCGIYIGLDTRPVTGSEPVLDDDAEKLLADILGGGAGGTGGQAQWQVKGIMTPYLTGEKQISGTSFGRKLDAIFLRPEDLQGKFVYARRYKILLPVAWVHRGFDYALKYLSRRKSTQGASEKLKITDERLILLNKLGLVDEKK
jgi:hypothetical protein